MTMDFIVCVFFIVLVDTIVLTTGLYNAALFKPAVQSSDYKQYLAYLGVDGNSDDNFTNGHCQHTWNETIPWWMVDLRGQFVVDSIILTNRGDLGGDYYHMMHNFTIDIFQEDPRKMSDFPKIKGKVCYNQTNILYNGTYTLKCLTGIVGRYVRIFKNVSYSEFMHLCEIEVLVSGPLSEETYFNAHPDTKLLYTVGLLVTLTGGGFFKCAQECINIRSPRCTAFNLMTTSETCELFRVNPFRPTHLNTITDNGTYFFIQDNFL